MGGGISKMAKQEIVATIRDQYQQSSKKEKGRILDEFTARTGHRREHGVRLLSQPGGEVRAKVEGRRIYDDAVRGAVIMVWEASGRICGKRLKAALPNLVDSMERHGHLKLDPEVRSRLLSASAATLDRLLGPIRTTAGSRASEGEGRPWGARYRCAPSTTGTGRHQASWRSIWWPT